jgi:hypothetical protein
MAQAIYVTSAIGSPITVVNSKQSTHPFRQSKPKLLSPWIARITQPTRVFFARAV